jgi:hypothetical protein
MRPVVPFATEGKKLSKKSNHDASTVSACQLATILSIDGAMLIRKRMLSAQLTDVARW